ncbi:MAG: hypothetical protein A2Z65_01460 [Gallionellales bacterium RIFCSPLOWO2_02_58_13]|nr:MAG: hypothetical protein A2Z65_01460 [Gallionellales bacterium RIFCSPLOWO2_02_58_13]
MSNQVQIMIDRDVYDSLQMLMVPPINDASSAIKSLLEYEGHASPAALALGAAGQHFSMAEELERANTGIYEGGGNT